MNKQSSIFLFIFLLTQWSLANSGLLSVSPRSDYENFGLFKSNSKCQNNLKPSLEKLNQLQRDGQQIALVTTGGTSIAAPRLQVKDVFQGRRYLDANQMLEAMEDALYERGLRGREQIQDEVKNCVRGRHKYNRVLTEPCTKPAGTLYAHMGIAVLNSPVHPEPYIIHFYTNKNTGWFRPAIRVETAAAYLAEKSNIDCKTKIFLPKWGTQMKIKNALKSQLPQRMLAPGGKAYNLISHPWGLKTQNCNEWLAAFLAGALHTSSSRWNSVSREQARDILMQTGFTPMKAVLGGGHSLASLIASFPGMSAHEGNFNHFYGVGDGLPSRSVIEWLERQDRLHSEWTIRGSFPSE